MAIWRQPQDLTEQKVAGWHCVPTNLPDAMRPKSDNGIDWTVAGMSEIADWLADPLRQGEYTWLGVAITSTTMGNIRFFFSDEQTAFEFKMRWV